MMSEDNQCSLDALDEFRMLDTNKQLPSGNYEENKMEGDGGERSLNASDDKNKLTAECLPAEALAVCLSYTGKDLRNARLTCRRFNQVIEDYQYMMNVIPVYKMTICELVDMKNWQVWLHVDEMARIHRVGMTMRCKLDEVMKYVRFLRPVRLEVTRKFDTIFINNYLTASWRKGIEILYMKLPILSFFPNVREMIVSSEEHVMLLAQISAHPSPIRRFELNSQTYHDLDENALILDALSKNSNKFNGGIEELHFNFSHLFVEAVIRFIENSKFAEKFHMRAWVKHYNNRDGGNDVYVENYGYLKFKDWMHSKGIPQSRDNDWIFRQRGSRYLPKFVYRSTQFELVFHNC